MCSNKFYSTVWTKFNIALIATLVLISNVKHTQYNYFYDITSPQNKLLQFLLLLENCLLMTFARFASVSVFRSHTLLRVILQIFTINIYVIICYLRFMNLLESQMYYCQFVVYQIFYINAKQKIVLWSTVT